MPESSLLVTKCMAPPSRAQLLPRASLIEQLNKSSMLPLVLLSAGAGFGKTTLLAAWASQRLPHSVAWLSLDRLDNEPLRFWSEVLAAIRTHFSRIGETALAQLQAPQPPQLIPLLTAFINDLATAGEEVTLILDDYHVIDEPSIHASLQFLLEHVPACLHLILTSRVDPPLALSRLRARGQLAELRDADLRVSEQEGAVFLRQIMKVQLSEADEQRLVERTEGWLAGLQLAALSLVRRDDPGAWVSAFSGSQRLILDYLQDEVLGRQSQAIQRFLLRVCILPRMNASLCQAVTGKSECQQMLEALEQRHLFVVPLDEERQWYRLHDLFREALLARLRSTQPALMPSLYEQAARWYERHGLLPDAIEAALKAGTFTCAAEWIERFIDQRSFRNPYHMLCRWLGQLPEEIMRARPTLSFWYALSNMFTSLRRAPDSWVRIESCLLTAEQGFEASGQQEQLGEAFELHAELAFFQDDFARMLAFVRQATPLLSSQSLMYATNRLVRGWDQLFSGNLMEARRCFLDGRQRAQALGSLTGALGASLLLGEACLAGGELRQAARYFQEALAPADAGAETFQQQLMTATGDRESFFVSWAYHKLAQLSYEWNDLAAAQHALAQARAFEEHPGETIHVLTSGGLIRARLLYSLGETAAAYRLLETWERHTRFPLAVCAIRACRARLDLMRGDLSAVEHWQRTREASFNSPFHDGHAQDEELPYVQQEEDALLLVRLALAREQAEAALQQLAYWKTQAASHGRTYALLEMLLLEALAHQVNRALPQAKESLLQALKLAQPEQYRRLFLDEGQAMVTLLNYSLKELPDPIQASYAHDLLAAFGHEQVSAPCEFPVQPSGSATLPEPLTPQEQRVLRLLAGGASNREIATQLVISLATAKKHMANILSKLGAANRTQALVRAREYGLL